MLIEKIVDMPESIKIITQDMSKRPDWDEYFVRIMSVVRERASCLKRKVGALIVKDHRILATGYNGAPAGLDHCEKTGCLRKELNVPSGQRHELCRGLHAEQNAIIQAAVHGTAIKGATLYCDFLPCSICTKMVINAGIVRVVFLGYYPDDLAVKMFTETDIVLDLYKLNSK